MSNRDTVFKTGVLRFCKAAGYDASDADKLVELLTMPAKEAAPVVVRMVFNQREEQVKEAGAFLVKRSYQLDQMLEMAGYTTEEVERIKRGEDYVDEARLREAGFEAADISQAVSSLQSGTGGAAPTEGADLGGLEGKATALAEGGESVAGDTTPELGLGYTPKEMLSPVGTNSVLQPEPVGAGSVLRPQGDTEPPATTEMPATTDTTAPADRGAEFRKWLADMRAGKVDPAYADKIMKERYGVEGGSKMMEALSGLRRDKKFVQRGFGMSGTKFRPRQLAAMAASGRGLPSSGDPELDKFRDLALKTISKDRRFNESIVGRRQGAGHYFSGTRAGVRAPTAQRGRQGRASPLAGRGESYGAVAAPTQGYSNVNPNITYGQMMDKAREQGATVSGGSADQLRATSGDLTDRLPAQEIETMPTATGPALVGRDSRGNIMRGKMSFNDTPADPNAPLNTIPERRTTGDAQMSGTGQVTGREFAETALPSTSAASGALNKTYGLTPADKTIASETQQMFEAEQPNPQSPADPAEAFAEPTSSPTWGRRAPTKTPPQIDPTKISSVIAQIIKQAFPVRSV